MASPDVSAANARNAAIARSAYLDGLNRNSSRDDWHGALREARRSIANALRASRYLFDMEAALRESGSHMAAFRNLLAPPLSQDQFKLLCPDWSKGSEKTGSPLGKHSAAEAAASISQWLDPGVAPWLKAGRKPSATEIRNTLQRTAALVAAQRFQTVKRNRVAAEQEQSVMRLLIGMGWAKRPSRQIDTRAALVPRTFMHKTRFATATSAPQEVDIACGLNGSYVAAVECKVTNDETNSVKRVNDVLKKAESWRLHWGSFVETVAILQGVISGKDVDRLCDANVRVFWSHDLESFRAWVAARADS